MTVISLNYCILGIILSNEIKNYSLRGGGGGQAYHFGKMNFELGDGQITSQHFEGSFGSIRAILPM